MAKYLGQTHKIKIARETSVLPRIALGRMENTR